MDKAGLLTEKEPMTHVFLKPCGCLSVAIINEPRMFKELSKAHTYAKKHGESYQLMETQKVREMEWKCPEHKHKAKKQSPPNQAKLNLETTP